MTLLEKAGLALLIVASTQFSHTGGNAIENWFVLFLFLGGWFLFMAGGEKHNGGKND